MRLVPVIALLLAPMPVLAWHLVEADKPFVHRTVGYRVQFPVGWKFDRLPESNARGATQDGLLLQTIYVDFRRHRTAFQAIRKSSNAGTDLRDLAADLLTDMTKARQLEDVRLVSIEDTELAGRPAFSLQFEYMGPSGDQYSAPVQQARLRYREVVIGAVDDRGLYLVGYRAPLLHYFARDLGVYAAVVRSFATRKPPAGNRQ